MKIPSNSLLTEGESVLGSTTGSASD